jgi:endonuclease I
MKQFYLILFFSSTLLVAQVPAGYYNSASGLSGFALKTELSNIITNGYNEQSYGSLITLYQTSDNDEYYDGGTQTGTILDMYSENPTGADPYNYSFNQNCGNFNSEGDCYNREHTFPQGFFNSQNPMRSDAHFVIPTDGWVNGGRGNLPYGEVSTTSGGITTYSNGTRRGPSATPGFTGNVFEPIDEFKGDIARMLFYFATRYENNFDDSSWDNPNASQNDPRDGSRGRFYEQWFIDLLVNWHLQDPVSQREIDRNNAIYNYQNNANPFIDNPQYVQQIWQTTASLEHADLSKINFAPNPSTGFFTLNGLDSANFITVYDMTGKRILEAADTRQIRIENKGIYLATVKSGRTSKTFKLIVR